MKDTQHTAQEQSLSCKPQNSLGLDEAASLLERWQETHGRAGGCGTSLRNRMRAKLGWSGAPDQGSCGEGCSWTCPYTPTSHWAPVAKPWEGWELSSAWGLGLPLAGVSSTSLKSPSEPAPDGEPGGTGQEGCSLGSEEISMGRTQAGPLAGGLASCWAVGVLRWAPNGKKHKHLLLYGFMSKCVISPTVVLGTVESLLPCNPTHHFSLLYPSPSLFHLLFPLEKWNKSGRWAMGFYEPK